MTSDFDTQKHDSDTSLASDRTTQKTTTRDAQVGFSATSEPSRHSTAELIALIERTTFVGSGAVYLSKDNTQAIKDRLAELQELNESLKLANSDAQHRVRQLEALEKPEWFFRWASRAMASGDFKGAVETIFYHPGNPYQKENPWAQQAMQPSHPATQDGQSGSDASRHKGEA